MDDKEASVCCETSVDLSIVEVEVNGIEEGDNADMIGESQLCERNQDTDVKVRKTLANRPLRTLQRRDRHFEALQTYQDGTKQQCSRSGSVQQPMVGVFAFRSSFRLGNVPPRGRCQVLQSSCQADWPEGSWRE